MFCLALPCWAGLFIGKEKEMTYQHTRELKMGKVGANKFLLFVTEAFVVADAKRGPPLAPPVVSGSVRCFSLSRAAAAGPDHFLSRMGQICKQQGGVGEAGRPLARPIAQGQRNKRKTEKRSKLLGYKVSGHVKKNKTEESIFRTDDRFCRLLAVSRWYLDLLRFCFWRIL